MDWQNKMNEIIDYLENRMCEEIDLEKAAKYAGYSLWEYQRIFSFMTNTSVGAYIRKRKLSLAVQEIMSSNEKIIDIALKYGYESPTAFSRAFSQLFGISPSSARDERVSLELYPRLNFNNNIIKRSFEKMKIAVLFGSHRREGKNKEIEEMLISLNLPHELDFIRMADTNISSCNACGRCENKNECVINDDFKSVCERLISADAIFLIVPVYALIPSKVTMLFERLTSIWHYNNLFGSENNPLLGKKVGIFTYCSCFICQCDDIAGIFRKFVVLDEYDETKNDYKYLTTEYLYSQHYSKNYTKKGPDNIFNHDIIEYVKSVALWLT